MPTKIGTVEELNQNKAIKIIEMTGVDLKTESGILKKSWKNEFVAHKNPNKKPITNEMQKEIITRKKVYKKLFQKTIDPICFTKDSNTLFGDGRINGALITFAIIIHTKKRNKIDKTTGTIFFIVISNNKNLHLVIYFQSILKKSSKRLVKAIQFVLYLLLHQQKYNLLLELIFQ